MKIRVNNNKIEKDPHLSFAKIGGFFKLAERLDGFILKYVLFI
jgi:hypothetical protein